jgi:uncharacterized membrane protein YkvA (DUF1232 family)
MMKKALTIWSRYKAFQEHIYTLYLVVRHPQTPGHIKLLTGLIILYIVSPVDLLPDLYPFVGYVDELILTPLFVDGVLKLVPPSILDACRRKTGHDSTDRKRKIRLAIGISVFLLLLLIYYCSTR